jgi:hypothetical protein
MENVSPRMHEHASVSEIVTRSEILAAVGGKTLGPRGSLTPAPRVKSNRGRAGAKPDLYADV